MSREKFKIGDTVVVVAQTTWDDHWTWNDHWWEGTIGVITKRPSKNQKPRYWEILRSKQTNGSFVKKKKGSENLGRSIKENHLQYLEDFSIEELLTSKYEELREYGLQQREKLNESCEV
jgi:hypothetical protein